MDFTQLKHFQAVARCGNITRAARELYITQPSLSKSISRLEEELGVPLFTHRKGKIELNDYGRIFLSSVDIAFSQLAAGAQTINRLYETNQHILSLTSNIPGYLPDQLPAFCALHPEFGIRQRDSSTPEMIELLLSRNVTMGISCEYIKHEMIDFKVLGRKEFVLAVHLDNPISCASSVRVHQLKDQTFICDTSRLRLEPLRKLCLQEGFNPHVGFEIENTDLVYNLVEANRGVAILPIGLCCQLMHHHPDHHLRLIRIDGDLPPIIIGIATHKDYQYSKASIAFEEYVRSQLAAEEEMIHAMGYSCIS